IDSAETKLKHENKLSCFIEINEWEQEMIKQIQAIAKRTRANIHEIMVKNIVQIRDQFEQLSTTMQQQQKEENYLENELDKVKVQLNQLKETISHINEKVHVKTSNNIDWNTLIHVINNEESIQQNNFQSNQEKQSSVKPKNQQRLESPVQKIQSDTSASQQKSVVTKRDQDNMYLCYNCQQAFQTDRPSSYCPKCENRMQQSGSAGNPIIRPQSRTQLTNADSLACPNASASVPKSPNNRKNCLRCGYLNILIIMKCTACNERNGNTRCEGCHSLFCLSCMNRHHDELLQQFQMLMDMRNELKESIDIAETKSKHENKLPCFNEINEWEQEMIKHIQAIANRTRENLCEIMVKNIVQIRDQFEQLSTTMQQQQKEENYLENELEKVKLQLNQLKETMSHIYEKPRVKTSNNIDWDTLIHVINNENSTQQNNFHTDQEKQSSFRPGIIPPGSIDAMISKPDQPFS
ncbi:unnamed protein product, partial [Adineta steineri]